MENENVTNNVNNDATNKTNEVVIKNAKKAPNFFIDRNQLQINIYVVYNILDGNIFGVSTAAIDNHFIQGIEQINYKFVFTKPNYQQVSRYKQLSMYWDNIAKNTVVNPFKMRNYIILNHLKRWENVTNQLGEKVQLKIDIDNTLTQESLDLVYTVNPAIIDCVMKQFERLTNIN